MVPTILFLLLFLLLVPSFAFSHFHDFNISIWLSPGLYSESAEPAKAGRERLIPLLAVSPADTLSKHSLVSLRYPSDLLEGLTDVR